MTWAERSTWISDIIHVVSVACRDIYDEELGLVVTPFVCVNFNLEIRCFGQSSETLCSHLKSTGLAAVT